jgi:hypothetical protein
VTKTYKPEITATAEADVTEIWEYIAHDNADAATAFILAPGKLNRQTGEFPRTLSAHTREPLCSAASIDICCWVNTGLFSGLTEKESSSSVFCTEHVCWTRACWNSRGLPFRFTGQGKP